MPSGPPSYTEEEGWGESVYTGKDGKMTGIEVKSSNMASWCTCFIVLLILLTIWAILGTIAAVILVLKDAIIDDFGSLSKFLNELTNKQNEYNNLYNNLPTKVPSGLPYGL